MLSGEGFCLPLLSGEIRSCLNRSLFLGVPENLAFLGAGKVNQSEAGERTLRDKVEPSDQNRGGRARSQRSGSTCCLGFCWEKGIPEDSRIQRGWLWKASKEAGPLVLGLPVGQFPEPNFAWRQYCHLPLRHLRAKEQPSQRLPVWTHNPWISAKWALCKKHWVETSCQLGKLRPRVDLEERTLWRVSPFWAQRSLPFLPVFSTLCLVWSPDLCSDHPQPPAPLTPCILKDTLLFVTFWTKGRIFLPVVYHGALYPVGAQKMLVEMKQIALNCNPHPSPSPSTRLCFWLIVNTGL